ncbi:imelysin family protein [Pseudoalteromonas sp. G4]|uniref:imelysin family protein n=1 Tax=Pseudoalteromonas sp. G4 TaxID=2992761 RepID=UPI00237D7F68|nr:imelysin family protein [Pseudoalteromonas sp. G4]MDE3271092.1 imelysin family protein [Pseudoalteromonas sp. G4]
MLISAKLKPIALVTSLVLTLAACSEDTSSTQGQNFGGGTTEPGNGGGTSFDEKALVANLVDNVITPTFTSFNQQAAANFATLSQYCAVEKSAAEGEASEDERLAALLEAQTSWRDTTALWQHAELMQMGPLLENEGELRNLIYSWPAKSLCGVDQDTAYFEDGMINLDSTRPYDIKERTATRRGLVSLEHLLFSEQLNHSCSIANDALADWNNRSDSERRIARCEFAIEVASDLVDNSQVLLDKWNGDAGYAMALKNAGEVGSSFDSAHAAVNVISDALFYLTEQVKDKKLALPLGYESNSCGLEACPQDVESPIAAQSLANIQANLAAFEKLFTGNGIAQDNTTGFDDFLIEEEGSDTKDAMLKGLTDSNETLESINGTLQQALIDEKEKVEQTHAKVKDVTDQLKHDFINKLALELPKSSAGDND